MFAEHFEKLSNVQEGVSQDTSFDPRNISHSINETLNMDISVDEVVHIIRKLKNGKACGIDYVKNEFLKNCSDEMLLFMTDLFNYVLTTGIIPLDWCI